MAGVENNPGLREPAFRNQQGTRFAYFSEEERSFEIRLTIGPLPIYLCRTTGVKRARIPEARSLKNTAAACERGR